MKKLFIIFAIVLLASSAFGATAEFQAVTQDTGNNPITPSGYNLYNTTSGRVKVNSVIIPTSVCVSGTCDYTFTTPSVGNTFVVTAVSSTGVESADSNTATYQGGTPKAPASLMIKQ